MQDARTLLIQIGKLQINTGMPPETPNVSNAYNLKTPEDSITFYADWAASYDQDFVREQGYLLHLHVAHNFAQSGGAGPVLDVGAGTGVCGAALRDLGPSPIDGTDISEDMLRIAARKDTYRDLFSADILKGLPVADGAYSGVVSSGTFTSGHVGPEGLNELIRITKPGGLIAISIHTRHYNSAGFAQVLESKKADISDLSLTEVRIYDTTATGDHKDDTAFVAQFRRT